LLLFTGSAFNLANLLDFNLQVPFNLRGSLSELKVLLVANN
jgi:hypothetical protein